MDLSSVRSIAGERRVRVAVDAMGGDFGPSEVVPGVLDLRAGPSRGPTSSSSATSPSSRTLLGADLPANIDVVHAGSGRRHGRAAGGGRPPRSATRRSTWRCDLVRDGQADAIVTAGHTGAGVAVGDPPPPSPARRRSTGPRRPDDHGQGTLRPARHRGRPPTRPAEQPRPVRDDGRALRRAGPRAWSGRAWPSSRSARRGGKGDARIQEATELLRATDLALHRQRRGQGPRRARRPTWSSATRSVGNVVIKFFEGLSSFIFGPAARRSSSATCGAASPTC